MNTTLFVTLDHISCYKCGVVFGIEASHNNRLLREGGDFHCPNGHIQRYTETACVRAEKAAKRAQELLESERRMHEYTKRDLATTEARRRSEKAAKTKIKNRIAHGVCPCCRRTFQNLAAHMKGQHPDFAHEGGTP